MRNLRFFLSLPAIAGLALALTTPATADLVIFDTSPVNNQANLTAAAGQTFTTPDAATLGANVYLKSIEQFGPTASAGENMTYGMQLWTNNAAPETWAPDTLLATTGVQTILENESFVFDFTPFSVLLNPNTVYAIRFVDENGDAIGVRIGLQGGNNGLGAANGSLFSAGTTPFSNGFDSAMIITTAIPEPTSLAVLGVVSLLTLSRRRR